MFKLCFKYTSGGKLAHLMAHFVPQLGEHIKGSAMPAPKGVHRQRYEGDAFCCASVVALGHLDVEGMPHAVFPVKSHLFVFDETALKGVVHADVQCGVLPLGPEGQEDISWPFVRTGKKTKRLLLWSKCCLSLSSWYWIEGRNVGSAYVSGFSPTRPGGNMFLPVRLTPGLPKSLI